MDSEPGRSLIVWSVRIGVACYAVAVWLWFLRPLQTEADYVRFRKFWLAAWLLVVVHVLLAFHFEHHWSHTAAIQHTAEMTQRVVGWHWSGGLYINYVFLLLWAADIIRYRAAGVTRDSQSQSIPSGSVTSWTMQAAAAFMMFNATAVFGPGWWIPVVLLFAALLCWAKFGRRMVAGTARQK